jgi:hypothetical protein
LISGFACDHKKKMAYYEETVYNNYRVPLFCAFRDLVFFTAERIT